MTPAKIFAGHMEGLYVSQADNALAFRSLTLTTENACSNPALAVSPPV